MGNGCFTIFIHFKLVVGDCRTKTTEWVLTGVYPGQFFLGSSKFVAGSAGGTNSEAKAKERRSLGKGSCLWCLSYRSSVDLGMDETFFA